jgi:hypothetical protein
MPKGHPDDTVHGIFRDLEDKARDGGKTLHKSFYVELIAYGRRPGVADRSARTLQRAIKGIGKAAIDQPEEVITAKIVKSVIDSACEDPFGDCKDAVDVFLKLEG